ncbi:TetR/AcrR family transcriptional regulator [Salibacterium aidingense]|uniref:TetR/AcrR family transcriptional regulator n=1 Tax=Salibacterium aidingense TaxID=384933 RepID=UPI0003F940B9|nr:TetR/AcrR family transcriptional regulator [Salibacterium aidingense]
MPKKIDLAERKEQIVKATFDVIYQYGFEKTTLREIAKHAGLSLGSVQYFFPKQQDIYSFAMEVIFHRFEVRMQQVVDVEEDQDIFEAAVRMGKQIVQIHTEEGRIENDIWVKFTLMASMNPEYQDLREEYRKINLNFAERILRILHQHGYIENADKIKEEAHAFIIFITGLVFESVIYDYLYDEEVVDNKVREYLKSICH